MKIINFSNWSLKFSDIVWERKNEITRPSIFKIIISKEEKIILLNKIDDLSIPYTNDGGKIFRLTFDKIVFYLKKALVNKFKSKIIFFSFELFFKNADLIFTKNNRLIRKKVFFQN